MRVIIPERSFDFPRNLSMAFGGLARSLSNGKLEEWNAYAYSNSYQVTYSNSYQVHSSFSLISGWDRNVISSSLFGEEHGPKLLPLEGV